MVSTCLWIQWNWYIRNLQGNGIPKSRFLLNGIMENYIKEPCSSSSMTSKIMSLHKWSNCSHTNIITYQYTIYKIMTYKISTKIIRYKFQSQKMLMSAAVSTTIARNWGMTSGQSKKISYSKCRLFTQPNSLNMG